MLTRSTRKAFNIFLYQVVFYEWDLEKSLSFVEDEDFMEGFRDSINLESDLDLDLLKKFVINYFEKYTEYSEVLKSYLTDWKKTYDLVKAILFAFLVEKDLFGESVLDKKVVSEYLKIAQDLAGKESVSVTHAVLTKLLSTVSTA